MSQAGLDMAPGFSDLTQEPFDDIPTEPEAFLRWATQCGREEGKFELSRGRVRRAEPYVTKAHARVCLNIFGELVRLVDDDRFDVGLTGFGVRTPAGIRSPDVLVDPVNADLTQLATGTPVLIAEVLSPSTIGTDFTEKLDEYTAIDSVQTYLICSQDEPRAWVWSRQSDAFWPKLPTELAGRESTIALAGLGVDLSMAAVFRGIPDAPTVG
jgi:Uma2 family endonuclease